MMSDTNYNTKSTTNNNKNKSNNDRLKPPQWREAVAGACSGAISRTLLAPIERIKLLQQLQSSYRHNNDVHTLTSIQLTNKIYLEEGILSFWRGNLPNVIRVAGTQALNFTCMDYYKRVVVVPFMESMFQREQLLQQPQNDRLLLLQQKRQQQQLHRRKRIVTSFISGGLAGATATTILYPIEFVRTRLAMDRGRTDQHPIYNNINNSNNSAKQNIPLSSSSPSQQHIHRYQHRRQYNGMLDVLRRIVQSDGIFGFYQGYGVALVGGIIYRLLHLGGYDACKTELLILKNQRIAHIEEKVDLSWSERFAIAQFISLLAGTMVYPFDSVRRRMMMQAGLSLADRTYKNSIHCTRVIWNTEGLRGFYLGIGPNLLRSVGGAIILVGYDSIRILL